MIDLQRYIKNGFRVCSISFMMLLSLSFYAQQNQVVSNIIRGSVVGLGWGTGGTSGGFSDRIYFDCSTCADIGNVYLIGLEYIFFDSTNLEAFEANAVEINGESAWFTAETRISPKLGPNLHGSHPESYGVHIVSFDFQCNGTDSIEFYVPPKDWKSGMMNYYLLIECLDTSSDPVAYSLVLNTADSDLNMQIPLSQSLELSTYSQANPIGFSIVGAVMNFMNGDASSVAFNGNYLGKIAGQDLSSLGYYASGVRGHFRYSNGVLEGLDDDTPDLVMDGTDALANVQSMMNGNSFYFTCVHEQPPSNSVYFTNPVLAGILTYTPVCDTFPVSVPKDTAICYGSQLPLHVSGGIAYEWYPSTGLSCSDCPDPVFSSDSSMFYTVKVYNNDSCFVSRPLHVTVYPEIDQRNSVTPAVCGTNTGEVVFSASSDSEYIYTLIGGETNYHGQFQDLNAGSHTFHILDSHGCQSTDTVIFVPEVNLTQADFELSPGMGAAPLVIDVTNTSQAFTQFEWFLNGVSTGLMPHVVYDSTGVYEIELVVWQHDPACADTAFHNLLVYDSLIVDIPNIFTPNSDGVNDYFEITINQPVKADIAIVNRWGNVVFSYSGNLKTGENPLWLPDNSTSDGVYFYTIYLDLMKESKRVEKEGFIQLIR